MKKLILLISIILTALPSVARNFFIPNTTWDIYADPLCGTEPGYDKQWSYFIGPDTVIFGQKCNFLDTTDYLDGSIRSKAECMYVYADGDKVFALPDTTINEWFLLYDFGLQPGECCEVMTCYPHSETQRNGVYISYIKCIERKKSNRWGGWPVLVLEEYGDPGCTQRCSFMPGVWYDGIGDERCTYMNSGFGYVGGTLFVESVKINGVELNEATHSIVSVDCDDRDEILQDDVIYDFCGRRVSNPTSGVYINASTKRPVVVR